MLPRRRGWEISGSCLETEDVGVSGGWGKLGGRGQGTRGEEGMGVAYMRTEDLHGLLGELESDFGGQGVVRIAMREADLNALRRDSKECLCC